MTHCNPKRNYVVGSKIVKGGGQILGKQVPGALVDRFHGMCSERLSTRISVWGVGCRPTADLLSWGVEHSL